MGYLCSRIKYSLLIWIIYLTGLTQADNNDNIIFQCPAGWTNINYMCYKAFNVSSPWDIADHYCKSMQSDLVKITDEWLNKDVGDVAFKIGLTQYWIGFTHLYVSGTSDNAHWSDGEDSNMKNGFWADYNPNMAHGECSFEVKTDSGPKWVLGHCDEKKPFVCEKTACTVGTYMCGNSRCIGQNQICDGKDDCKDGSDEENCPNLCRYYETGSFGSLNSKNHPQNYQRNSFCMWKIRSDLGTAIHLTFSDFLTESNTDFVEIFVGSLSESEAFLKYRLSGSIDTQRNYTSPNNMMMIKFTSDRSNEKKGFKAKWIAVSSSLKPIELNAFPKGNLTVDGYRYNEQNTWTIRTKKRREIITLQKMEMDLLSKDEVIVFDGDSLSSPKLATYKSTSNPLTTPQFVQSTGGSLMILFKSRGHLSNGRFSFSYQEGCEIKIKEQLYIDIMSPGYDIGRNYPNSQDCKWYLEIPSNHSYTIQIDSDYDIDTPSDTLYIYNIVNSKSIVKYNSTGSGQAKKSMKIDPGDVLINLKTNAIVNKKGFKAVFSIDCPDPKLDKNTIASPASKAWPRRTTLKVSCQPGYSFYSEEFATNGSTNVSFVSETSVMMICLKGGQWNVKTIPQCLPKYCGPVTPIKNGRVMNATGVRVGGFAQYTCSDGYTIVGKDTVQCQENGEWEAVPKCTATGCQSPPNIINGQVKIRDGTRTSVGSIVLFTCHPGYQIEGVPISQCMKSAKWSDKPPSCKILNCSAFGLEEKIPNSSIDPPGDVNFKESKNVTCDAGYSLNGNSTILCLSDQSHSTLPTCQDIDECLPSSKLNQCNQICVNTPGSYYCKCFPGYQLKVDNVTCEDINECETNNGGCEQNCKNTAGSHECSCKDGYTLYIGNYTMNYSLPPGDSGKSTGDVFHLNHSCVPDLCPGLGNLLNGFSQPQREFSHYGDAFYFSCKIGFALKGAAKTVCSQNGNWTSPLPTCEAIKCPPNGNAVHTDVPYLDYYNFTCDVIGKPKEHRSRQCLYDPLTHTYRLLGDSYVCEEIDCGQPKTIPGMVEVNVTNTTYGSQYEIKCSALYRLQGNSSSGNAIRCGNDGKWDYGDIKCTGVTCEYPSVPVEGTVEVKTFTEGSIATYNCTKEGYVPSGFTQRKCVKNKDKTGLVWDQKMPTCVDMHPPIIKNGTCGDSITLEKYSMLNISMPEFADNSESFTVEIEPAEAITGFVVTKNMSIVYTATDSLGHNVSCLREIIVEDRPLEITCPQDIIEHLSNTSEIRTIAFNESMVTVTGPGIDHSVTFTPKELNISESNLDKIEMIVVEATNGQKTVKCTFYVDVRAKACSAVSIPHVQYANWRSAGDITFTCQDKYGFPDAKLGNEMKTQCSSSWDTPFTSCSKLDVYASFYGNMTFIYESGGTISDSCAAKYQTVLLKMAREQTIDACSMLNFNPHPVPKESTFQYTIDGSKVSFHGLMENKASVVLDTFAQRLCLAQFGQQLNNPLYKLYTSFAKLTSSCGNLALKSVKSNVFSQCNGLLTEVDVGKFRYCVACPPGSYIDMTSGIANCTLCPIGEYQDKENETSCQKCPEGNSTYFPGGYDVSMCKAKCPAGFFSATGVPPCKSCPKNTYSKNSTYCEACPVNTKSREHAASSIESCKAKCAPGSYSYDGYEPCNLCPQGFYSNQDAQTKCLECDDKTSSSKAGADNKNKCIDVATVFCNPNPCKNGQCLPLGHLFTCNCSSGYTGDLCDKAVDHCSPNPCYHGGKCYNDGLDYKCNCSAGTYGRNCESIVGNCKNETCKNQGICANKINATECFCLKGYGGDFCEKMEYECTKKPCKNGVCRNLGTDNYKCDCPPGFKGEDCEIKIDNCASSPCLFNSTCTNLVNDFRCNCISGYSGKTCNKRAELCSNANCTKGNCVPNVMRDSYTCSCDVGYTYNEFCQFSMKTANGTINNFYNKSENIPSQTCISKCSEDAQCKAASYDETNKTCYFYKMETDACCKVFTKECTKPSDNFWTPWYTIEDSVKPLAVQNMLKNIGIDVCDGKLTSVTQCRSEKQTYDKMRPDKYAMSLNLNTPCVVDNLNCQNGNESECSIYRIRFQCAVSKVMQNNQCEAKSACHDVHCENGGICVPLGGSCACPIMYNQPFCRTKKDFCLGKDCGNGTCISASDKATCDCHKGFEGTSCSKNIDDCKTKPCDISGTKVSGCQDLINDYFCPCKAGYKGKNCTVIIDNCQSNPCLHQGTCKTLVNDFNCTCPDGWVGKRCEKLDDHCKTDRCTNNGVCFNLFKTHYCRCEPNTFGSNCSESVNICKDVNPCLNDANCTEFGGKAHCTCKQGFTGVGCQITVDFCKSKMCANGGTCITMKNSYKCQCPPGFNGTNCEQTKNDCTTSIQTCEEPTSIKCPLGKTGEKCTKEISNDYDLKFYLSEKNGIATMTSPVVVSGNNLSLSLWVRLSEKNGQGTFLNLFMIKSSGAIEEKVPVLRVGYEGVTYTTRDGNEVTVKTKSKQMIDGRWNLFTMTISDFGESAIFRLNTFAVFEKLSAPIINFFGKKCVVILGCYYDAKQNMPIANKGFYGELSQVNLYSKSLDFKSDVRKLVADPKADVGDILVGWGNYKLGRGVRKIVPSTVNASSPAVAQVFIGVKSCPQMVSNYGSQGRTLLRWEPPQFTDYPVLKQNYRPGTTVLWDRYAVTYAAKYTNGNVALCNFMVYAKESNCTKPEEPYEGTVQCNSQEFPYYSCNITCNSGRALTAPAPLLFTCGPSGCWHPENRHMPMRLPPCGQIKPTEITINLNLKYNIQSTTCDAAKNAMKPKLIETMKNLNAQNGFILCKLPNCSDILWNIICNDRLNAVGQDFIVNAKINRLNGSIIDLLTRAALDDKDFDYPSYGVGTILKNQFSLSTTRACNEGEALIDGRCVECTPGYHLRVSTKCEPCPVGTYQSKVAQTNCTKCPSNHTTLGTGHMNVSHCKVKCPAGESFDIATDHCKKCDILSYQDLEGQFFCKPCLSGKSTNEEGATSETQCTETCSAGYEFTTNCTECQIGFYRENDTANTCKKCSNNTITPSTGATSENECNITACFAGSYLNETSNNCDLCPDGQYQDEMNNKSCKPCQSVRYRTGKLGAKKLEDCKFFCESGFEVKNKSCQSCPKGMYKDNNEDHNGFCKSCPATKTTITVNSSSESDCKIHKCPVGQQPNANQSGCDPCPLGTYQPEADQTECIKCNANYSTRTDGSIDPNSCEVFCDSGYERVAGKTSLCKECRIGYFKDNGLGRFSKCQLCPNGNITYKVASTSERDCTKANCSAGQYLDPAQNKCFECNYGEYQNEKWKTNCTKCPVNYTTYTMGANKNTSCLLSCDSGSELVNNECQLCQIGYYRNNSSNLDQMNCLPCPDPKFVTEKEGAVSAKQCTVANCTAGFYLTTNNICIGCSLNEFQNVSFQNKCHPCAPGFKTWKTNSTSCVRKCPAGEMHKDDVCTKCPIGFYRKIDTETCTKCPNEFLTKKEGATNESFCDVPPCKAGEFYNVTDCVKCPVDFFQEKQYQSFCEKCETGKYTKTVGTTKKSECLSFCATKKHNCSNNATCIDDPAGFRCECNKNYIKKGIKCIHLCDTNYCENGATCSRSATVACACTKYYDGPQCQRQLSAKEISKNSAHSIIGAVIGVLAGILILILVITYVCVRMRNPSLISTPPDNVSFGGTLSTKFAPTYVAVNSLASQPILDQEPQVNAFTNAAYDEDSDPAIFTK